MARNWSSLPIDLLGAIAIKLEAIEDFTCYSAVCRSWNHASSSIKHLWKGVPVPWILLAENKEKNPDRKVFNLSNGKCYKLNLPETFGSRCWGSPFGWIAMVRRDLTVQLFNPITNAKLHFPPCETLPHPPKYFAGIEAGEDYYHWVVRAFLHKLIVVRVSQGDHHDFAIAVIYDFNLAFARHGDQSWTSLLVREGKFYMVDLVTVDNYLFGLYNHGGLVYWKVNELVGQEPVKPIEFSPPKPEVFAVPKVLRNRFLVQSGNDFLLVIRYKEEIDAEDEDGEYYTYDYQTIFYEVYRLNPKGKSWEETKDVGSVSLFIGCNYSMSVPISVAKCLQPNSIYFTDDEFDFWLLVEEFSGHGGGHDMGVYDVKSEEIRRFYEGDDTRSTFCTPTWFIPNF